MHATVWYIKTGKNTGPITGLLKRPSSYPPPPDGSGAHLPVTQMALLDHSLGLQLMRPEAHHSPLSSPTSNFIEQGNVYPFL